jgi:hypothetical protein
MTKRERTLATVFGGAVVLGGGLIGMFMIGKQLWAHDEEIESLKVAVAESQKKIDMVDKEKPKLDRWKRLSLPADINDAKAKYKRDIEDLLRKHRLYIEQFPAPQQETKSNIVHPTKPGKVPIWTGLNYYVRVKARMANLIAFIQEFQAGPDQMKEKDKQPWMHRIKSMTIERSDTSAKKSPEEMTVQMTFEALIILDAQQPNKKEKFALPSKPVLAWEVREAMSRAPTGMASLQWALSTDGPILLPLNPPMTNRRTYADIARKNPFMGGVVIEKETTGGGGFEKVPTSRPEDELNLMRFNRFIALTHYPDGSDEARFWDYFNDKRTTINVAKRGTKNIKLVQTSQFLPLISGDVKKVENHQLIFQVFLNSEQPKYGGSSKWWRYPDNEYFYSLHKEDVAALIAEKKYGIKESDADKLYLLSENEWQRRIKKGTVDMTGMGAKAFKFTENGARGEVILEDRFSGHVVIIKMNVSNWPPQPPYVPSIAFKRLYPEFNVVYNIHKSHLMDLVANKKAKADEIDRTFVMHAGYWDWLVDREKLIKTGEGNKTFTFYKGLIKGDILERKETDEGGVVVFRTAEKYCHCPGNKEAGIKDHWHEGYCVLPINKMVQEALLTPLPPARLKEFTGKSAAEGE